MIFSCGLTWDEQKKRRGEWHDFFAILPRTVRISDDGQCICAFLQTIERRSTYWSHYMVGGGWDNEYRLKGDEPQNSSPKERP